ncbi:uncharacterized protein knl1 [Scyliorhinus torazame]
MDENCPVFPEANVENRDGKCKRRQSGILKISRSPLRTLKEADVSQKIEQVGKLRRSSRRVSFAETKEVKEFVTDKMMIIQDVENGIDSQKENQLNELERDMMSLTTNFSIAGMDALLHAPLRTPLQQFEPCDHIETVSKHQIFPDSGIQMRREDAVESSGTKVTSRLPKQIDFKSFLTRFDSPEPTYSNVCFDTGEERANKSFGSIRQNEVPKLQKTIDFKTFLNSTKQSDTDENIMVSMSSIFEEPAMKQTDFGVTSTCNAVEDIEITNDTLLQINSNKNLDPNRTLLFLDQDNDMEFTSSHTIAINHFAMGNSTTTHSSTVPKNVERLGTEGPFPFLKDKTIVFSGEEYMDMTRSDTVPIDVRQVEHLTNQNRLTAVTNQKTDRSILPSIPNEHKIFSDNGYCGKMNQSVTLGTSKLTSSSVSILSSFPSDEAITFSEANGVDIKKGQGITIDNGSLRQGRNEAKVSNKMTRLSNARPVLSSFPCDETMMFSEANDVDITKSHTITIDSESFGKVTNEALGSTGIIPRLTEVDCSLLSFPRDKTIMFSEANDMDITKRHTVTIDSGNLGEVTNKILASMKLATRRSTVGSILSSFPTDKTMVISESNDMDFTKSHTVAIDGGKLGLIVNEISSSTRMTPRLTAAGCPPLSLPSDKTMVFSAANDMDITKGHTVPIDSVNPVQVKNQIMGFTSMPHKLDVPGSIRSFHRDKTIKLSEANDMDITKSHTVTIESKNLGHVTNETYTSTKQASFGNNVGCIPSPFPIDKTMVFSEANDMDQSKSHISSIDRGNLNSVVNWTVGSRMPFPSGKTTVFSEADDLDITKRHTVAMESGNLGSVANHSMDLDKKASIVNTACSVPSSVPNDKTLLFTKANDMDITKSHTVPIESGNLKSATNHNAGLNKMTSRQSIFRSIQPSFPSDNTMVFSEANYMDMTRSHTVAIESGNLGLGTNKMNGSMKLTSIGSTAGLVLSSFPSDETRAFSEANDRDITKSRTVTIESKSVGQVTNEALDFTRMTSKLNVPRSILSSFHSDSTMMLSEANEMDITKSHTVAIDSGNLGQVTNETFSLMKLASTKNTVGSIMSSFPSEKTMVFSESNDMDITKSHVIAIESENLRLVKNHTMGSSKKVSIENTAGSVLSSFPSDKTMVFSEANDMDITKSHVIAIESENLRLVKNHTMGSSKKVSIENTAGSVLSSFPSDKTMVFSEANDMDITKSHVIAIESENLRLVKNHTMGSSKKVSIENTAGSVLSSFPSDKTMVFSEANDMDIIKSSPVAIESGNVRPDANHTMDLSKIITRRSTARSTLSSFPSDKTVVFSEANNMDIAKSHTFPTDSKSFGKVTNEALGSTGIIRRLTGADCSLLSFPSDKTMVFSEANGMDKPKSHTVAIVSGNGRPDANHTMDSSKMNSRRNTARSTLSSFPGYKTVVFSGANDMDRTKSHTVPIDSESLGKVINEAFSSSGMVPRETDAGGSLLSFPRAKTMVFSEANDMDITKSRTVAIESRNDRADANHTMDSSKMTSRRNTAQSTFSSFPGYKTVVFSEANEMDGTKSHTVPIDRESLGKVINEAFSSSGMVPRETTAGGSLLSFPRDKTMVFSEANDMDITKSRTVAIESGNDRADANHTMDSSKMTSRRNTARSTLSSFPGYKTAVFSGANEMDGTKSHTVAIESGSLESTTNESLASDKVASRFNAPGSVLSFLPNGKIQVSEPVTAVTKIDTVPIHNKHDVSSNYKILQLVLEKGKNCFVNHSDNVEFASIQNTVENTICNVNCVVHTRRPDSFTGHAESTILNMGTGTEQEGEPVRSTCVTEVHEKLNGKGIKKYVLCTTNSLDSNLMCNNDNAQETRSVDDQNPEAAPEEFVRHKVSDAQSEGTVNSAIAESISTASKSLGHNQSRKSCLANMPSLQKLNSITNVTYGIPVGESGHANWKTLGTKTQFSKQHSLVRDMSKYKISLGIFPPKLPNRENLYEAINSNQQDATKTSEEDLCSSLFQNVTYTSNKLQGDSNIFKPNVGPEINSVIQIESQIADHDQVENTIFDKTEPSHCLKSSDVPCLLIPEQFRKEASPKSHENVTGPDQFLGGSIMIKSVDQRLYQKRAWTEEEENENVGSKRKMRNLGPKDIDSSRQKATGACVVQWEGLEHKIMEENLLGMMTKSLNSTSSLNSTKGDGTSAIAITPKCNLNTSLVIIEESELHEKLMDGQITVREFFKLLKVQTHAQKSRQSELQVNVELDKSSAFENWLAVKFIHRPKREVYEEDSSALSAAIAELKEQLLDLDKLLSEVNLPLWKDVMQMTEEELQQFRSCLNVKKTTFVKRTKVICHEQKVQLYSAQLNMLKEQRKLRNEYENSLDDMLHKMDDCLASLHLANLDHLGECCADVIDNDESMKQLEQTVTNGCEELKKLQEEHRDMESQLAKVLAEKELKEKTANLCNLKEEFQELLEWTLFLYQDEQAVYQFLYESLELTLKFGEPENAGGVVSLGEKCRKILDLNLESVLDEDEAPLQSKLVHDLIMTYWKSRGSWHNVYTNESQLPMFLLDMSLVVSRYRLLGDELEYFLNWGSKFGILKTEIQPMDVKYLFTSYDALSKFELTFHLKPSYPWGPLQFTFNSWFGNISGEHINEVLLTVKPGPKYLTRIVKSLFLMLLIIPGALRFR